MPTISSEGALVLDGTEQILVEKTTNKVFEGHVDLTPLLSGDTVVIRGFQKVKVGGTYQKFAPDRTITGPPADIDKIISFLPRAVKDGYKITIEQTLGTFRTVDFRFFET